jgi:hypothetical protein
MGIEMYQEKEICSVHAMAGKCFYSSWVHLQNCKKQLLGLLYLSAICRSVCMERLGSHCMDFGEIWYFSLFKKSLKKIQVSLTYDKNNKYFTLIPMYIYGNISPNSC